MKDTLTIDDLNRNQIIELKERYMIELAVEGVYGEIMGTGESPSLGEIANADNLIDDAIILERYQDTVFSEDDFYSNKIA